MKRIRTFARTFAWKDYVEWFIVFIVLLLILCIAGIKTPAQTTTLPYPLVLPGTPLGPVAGPMGGLVYGMIEAPRQSIPDTRQWSMDSRSNHRMQIRSWTLHLYSNVQSAIPYISKQGFCSRAAALAHAIKNHPHLYHTEIPSPLPAWRCDGFGAWGSP